MRLKDFLPSPQLLCQETLATLAGLLISAWIIRQIPALQQMVNDAKPTTLTNTI